MNKPHRDSLYTRLQEAGKLDELMLFLEEPPVAASHNPNKVAAKMVTDWGFPCTAAAISKLYRTKVLLWCIMCARDTAEATENIVTSETDISKATSQRIFELLSHQTQQTTDIKTIPRPVAATDAGARSWALSKVP